MHRWLVVTPAISGSLEAFQKNPAGDTVLDGAVSASSFSPGHAGSYPSNFYGEACAVSVQ
jgi:hypothetical protein